MGLVTVSDVSRDCGKCGLPMSQNPHPNAGKIQHLLAVGAVWVCIPCTVKTRHAWCERALAAERELERQEQRSGCDMGVGCEEFGICYAEANGAPERCPRNTSPLVEGTETAEADQPSSISNPIQGEKTL